MENFKIVRRYSVDMGKWFVGYWKNNTQFHVIYVE
jgi:hypothetical protein